MKNLRNISKEINGHFETIRKQNSKAKETIKTSIERLTATYTEIETLEKKRNELKEKLEAKNAHYRLWRNQNQTRSVGNLNRSNIFNMAFHLKKQVFSKSPFKSTTFKPKRKRNVNFKFKNTAFSTCFACALELSHI